MASKAVILLGGPTRGTRMRPITLTMPKPLFPIAGRAIIWHGIQALAKLEGLKEVILIGFYDDSVFTQFIKDTSRDFPGLSIRYLREFQALGTAGGLYHFRDAILKGSPEQIFVLHADIACSYPLAELKAFHDHHRGVGTIMGVKVPRESASKYGCIVTAPDTKMAMHYVEKPETFISDIINGGIYLFDKAIFDEIRSAMDEKLRKTSEDPLSSNDELRLEQDVIAPLASAKRLFVYETPSFWRQIKTAGSAVPANALILSAYKTTNPTLLRRRAATLAQATPAEQVAKKGPEIIEPCFIDETADVDPSAKIGPNVSIGAMTRIGYGCRVRDAIILDNVQLDKNACVLNAIVCDDCRIGPWARVEGSPATEASTSKQNITILGKEVTVAREILVRSCIVLPHKGLSKSSANEVLL